MGDNTFVYVATLLAGVSIPMILSIMFPEHLHQVSLFFTLLPERLGMSTAQVQIASLIPVFIGIMVLVTYWAVPKPTMTDDEVDDIMTQLYPTLPRPTRMTADNLVRLMARRGAMAQQGAAARQQQGALRLGIGPGGLGPQLEEPSSRTIFVTPIRPGGRPAGPQYNPAMTQRKRSGSSRSSRR